MPSLLIIARCSLAFSYLRPHDLIYVAFAEPAALAFPRAKSSDSAGNMLAAGACGGRRSGRNGARVVDRGQSRAQRRHRHLVPRLQRFT